MMDLQTWKIITESVEMAAARYCKILPAHPLLGYEDFYQAGMLAALKHLNKYNPARANLSTFLYPRVYKGIKDLLRAIDHSTRRARNRGYAPEPPLSLDLYCDGISLHDYTLGDSPDPAAAFARADRSKQL